LLAAAIVIGVTAHRLRALAGAPPTDFDDAYMFIRYARHVLSGDGLCWNRGEAPVFGATSLPHVWLLAAVIEASRWARPGLDDAGALQLCSRAEAALLAVVLVAICTRFSRHRRLRGEAWLWGALLVPLVVYAQPFEFHAESGMDTMLAALTNALLLFAALRCAEKPSRLHAVVVAGIAYAAYLVRPDNILYAALVPPLCLLWVRPEAVLLRALPRRRAVFVAFVVALAVLGAADFVIKRHVLGSALPLGAYAKSPGFYEGFAGEYTWNPFLFLKVFLIGLWPFVVALTLFTGYRGGGRLAAALLIPVAVTFAVLFRMNQIMGHLGRFFFPALPFVVVGAALSFDRWLGGVTAPVDGRTRPGGTRGRVRLAAGVVAAAVLLAGGPPALDAAGEVYEARAARQQLAPLGGYEITADRPLPEMDSWRASEQVALFAWAAPVGTRFAMSEHGVVGARAPDAFIIDVLGLHDRVFARDGFSAAELWRRRPDVIWMPHPDHTQMIRDIMDSDELWNHYVFYPDAFMYGLAIRRDSPAFAELSALFLARWSAAFPGFSPDDYAARRVAGRR
jgi:hypothetical protein